MPQEKPDEPPLSKNALKRKLKNQRWEEGKDERRAHKKAKLKEKKERQKLSGEYIPKKNKISVLDQKSSGIRVVVDCGFDDLMTDKEIISMSSQLTRCHSENRRSQNTVELFFTTLNGRLQERMETNLHGVHLRWRGVHPSTDPYQAVLKDVSLDDFVYLTADSPNVLQTLEASKVYILGGLVDRNRYKNICYDKAVKEGIQHGRLPIGDYIKLSTRHILTVNQVLEIMLRWLESRSWEKALLDVIPKRKFPELQDQKGEANDDQGESIEALERHDSTDGDGEGAEDSEEHDL